MKTEDVIMKFVAVLAPVPTAWLVGESTMTLVGFPLPVAVAAAATVEGLGFVAVNTVTEMMEFNRHINTIEAAQKMYAPVKQAIGVVALYVVTAVTMTIILHVAPILIPFAPLPFIAMMISVGWMYALRKDHAARVERWGQGRSAMQKKRKSAAVSKSAKRSPKKPAVSAAKYPRTCEHCDYKINAPQAVGAHMKKHHPELCKPSAAEVLFNAPIKDKPAEQKAQKTS